MHDIPWLDPFYPIVDSADWVEKLVPAGVRFIQLRIKNQTVEQLRSQIERALAACRAHGAQLVVNDYWQLALEAGADFIHLGQEDLDTADLQAIRAGGLRLGVSTHSHAELERALKIRPDYIALGPVYPTTLKEMPWEPQGLARLHEWKKRVEPLPLIAIGGIQLDRAKACYAAGADSISMVTDIVFHPQPLQQTKRWLQLSRRYG